MAAAADIDDIIIQNAYVSISHKNQTRTNNHKLYTPSYLSLRKQYQSCVNCDTTTEEHQNKTKEKLTLVCDPLTCRGIWNAM